ncbi:MAG: type II secretion system protein GspG, partial [Spirochaetia bacterium]|nr:type II secretion system protein GspG [Spirochaetia bacterium]
QSERRGPAEPFVYEVEEDETPASAPKDANRIRALNDLSKLEMAIIIYRAENGKFPATLDELVKATDDHKEGYLAGWTEIPKDPWGSAYTYTFSESTKMTTLRSLGPNKQDDGGAGDDVSAGSK